MPSRSANTRKRRCIVDMKGPNDVQHHYPLLYCSIAGRCQKSNATSPFRKDKKRNYQPTAQNHKFVLQLTTRRCMVGGGGCIVVSRISTSILTFSS